MTIQMNELYDINICDNNYIPWHLEGDLSLYQCQTEMLEMVGTEHLSSFCCSFMVCGSLNSLIANNLQFASLVLRKL